MCTRKVDQFRAVGLAFSETPSCLDTVYCTTVSAPSSLALALQSAFNRLIVMHFGCVFELTSSCPLAKLTATSFLDHLIATAFTALSSNPSGPLLAFML